MYLAEPPGFPFNVFGYFNSLILINYSSFVTLPKPLTAPMNVVGMCLIIKKPNKKANENWQINGVMICGENWNSIVLLMNGQTCKFWS